MSRAVLAIRTAVLDTRAYAHVTQEEMEHVEDLMDQLTAAYWDYPFKHEECLAFMAGQTVEELVWNLWEAMSDLLEHTSMVHGTRTVG